MDREQQVIARGFGYEITEMPGLTPQPKLTYYDREGEPVVLPADPYSMHHYLSKGFTLSPPKSDSQEKFTCGFPGCGKSFTKAIALAGHKRSHK